MTIFLTGLGIGIAFGAVGGRIIPALINKLRNKIDTIGGKNEF